MSYAGIQSLITYYQTTDPDTGSNINPGEIWYDPDAGADGVAYCWCTTVDGSGTPGWYALVTFSG